MASEEFKLIGAREILNLVPGAVHIENQVAALERAVTEDPAMALDLAKALIETVCKTILNDRGVPIGAGWDCPQLARETALKLKLVPDSHIHIREVNDSLRRVVAGLVAVVQNLCELRNAQGMASHGKDAFAASLEPIQAQFAARAADTLVCYLFRAHKSYLFVPPTTRLRYGDYTDFDSYVDENSQPIQILALQYVPSEVLFKLDVEAYRDALASFQQPEEAS